MTGFELLQTFDRFDKILEDAKFPLENIGPIVTILQNVSNVLDGAINLSNVNEAPQAVQMARQELGKLPPYVRSLPISQLFIKLASLRGSLEQFLSDARLPHKQPFENLLAHLKDLESGFEAVLKGGALSENIRLAQAAKKFSDLLADIKATIRFTRSFITAEDPLSNAEGSLTLFLAGSGDAALISRQLRALNDLYSEICQLLNISEEQYPLRYIHLEVGSTFARIAGAGAVIGLLRVLLQRALDYWRETYTREGKIAAIPKEAKAIEALLHLSDELKARGVDAANMIEHLRKASVVIASDLGSLLDQQRRIQVDATVYELPDEPAWVRERLEGPGEQRLLSGSQGAEGPNADHEKEPK